MVETGMTAMVLDRDGLQAHKSWIFTRDYVLCLGAGIRSDSILAVTYICRPAGETGRLRR